jgi:cbb3-type cytochrome oxidase maturation protein
MEVLVILVPLALGLGLVGLLGFLWSLKSGQYDDLEGAAWRAIADDDPAHERRSDQGVAGRLGHPAGHTLPRDIEVRSKPIARCLQ